ncbi:hypothetical protein GGX14DRAFT_632908 [Mycena pura]|uniref:Uncharacterized protein n=1 Tax=Mycena pura TaxID=153505 RepID=A0AAD6YCE6_9AGAR|nr:hypothetical protein GGX14DRAFT_632908 [Mycena pura]
MPVDGDGEDGSHHSLSPHPAGATHTLASRTPSEPPETTPPPRDVQGSWAHGLLIRDLNSLATSSLRRCRAPPQLAASRMLSLHSHTPSDLPPRAASLLDLSSSHTTLRISGIPRSRAATLDSVHILCASVAIIQFTPAGTSRSTEPVASPFSQDCTPDLGRPSSRRCWPLIASLASHRVARVVWDPSPQERLVTHSLSLIDSERPPRAPVTLRMCDIKV